MLFSKQSAPTPPISHDILMEKQNEVARLARQANEAVDLVTRTINDLEGINQQIDGALSEIDAYAQERLVRLCPNSGATIPLSFLTSQSSWIPAARSSNQ